MKKRHILDGLDDEIRDHLEREIEENVDRGMTPDDARSAALRTFGNVTRIKEDARSVWAWARLEQLLDDVRTGARILTRSPGLSAIAVLLIAIVIGGNTTVFSIVHGILTKPAPGIEANGLVSLGWIVDRQPVHPVGSYVNYVELSSDSTTVRPLLAFQTQRFTLTLDDGSYAANGDLVSGNYFETLGVHLVRGRTFTDEESRPDASGLVAVIGYRVWQDQFRGAEDVIGHAVAVDGHPATIVGVAPLRFQGAWLGETADVWVPLLGYASVQGVATAIQRLTGPMTMVGRLVPGFSFSQAQAEFDGLSKRLEAAHPDANKNTRVALFPYSATAAGDSAISSQAPRFLAIFSVVTLLTLLIVCANVANLMLARAVVRQREMAVRQSFGASRGRIVRILVVEGAVISLAAWAAACLFAMWMSHAVVGLLPPSGETGLPVDVDLAPDWRVVAYAMLLAVVGTVAFTVAPAVRAWRQDLLPLLKAGEHGVIQGRSRLSNGLVILQLAFTVLLLTTAGLAYRSLSAIYSLDVGFQKSNLLLVTVNTSGTATTKDANADLLDRLREGVQSVPGVLTLSYARRPPAGYWPMGRVQAAGTDASLTVERNDVGPAYLATLGVVPVQGRDLADQDRTRASKGAVISQNVADALWPRQSALGRTLELPSREHLEVVGVTPNGFFSGYRGGARPGFVFVSAQQEPPPPGETTFYIRYAGELDAIAPGIGRAIRNVDARVPIVYVRTMDAQLDNLTSPVRALTMLLTLFASGSLVIAALGQYAVIAFTMKRRTRDFGVRMALGASAGQILASVVREGLRLTTIGLAIGLTLSIIVAMAMQRLLYGVSPADVPTYVAVCGLLGLASLAACYLPARRASRVNPMLALRQE